MLESTAQEEELCSGLRVTASLIGKLNLADYQNAVPALRELTIVNDTDEVHEHLVLSASSDPCFFKSRRWHVDAIGPRQTLHISNLDLQLDGPLLARLNESEFARAKFELASGQPNSAAIDTWEDDVELLPRNHWGGLSHLPEIVAAFVQPNDPAVDRLLKRAAQLLRENDQNPALNGYEAGPKHAWEILSAIWGAVAEKKLDYALPAASFEQTGQKIRSPGQIFESGIATCLDLALLFAAAAEQAGLNPLVILTEGHALTGCWLRAEEFATTVVDDPSALRKRVLLRELELFEATAATSQPAPPFSRACEIAAKLIAEGAPDTFEVAVDVRRARMHKIRPLSVEPTAFDLPHEASGPTGAPTATLEDAPDFPEELTASTAEADPRSLTPADRVARWQRKLLDLSLRNSLLNFRKNKRAVIFEAPDPGRLEDTLASGKALKLLARPELMEGSDPRSLALHEGRTHEDARRRHALEGLAKAEIFATAGADDLEATLVELYRAARTSLQESGANTLFLALGFLVWTQEGKDPKKHWAPLILIPVSLDRRSVRSGFTLTLHDDEPQFNPTLVEMLHQDFQLSIGIPEGDFPKDDAGLDVARIWARVSEAIKDIKGWEVVPEVVLSTFSFAKHLMWKDLVVRTDQLRENPVVRHLIDTPREPFRSDVRFADPKTLDQECDPREIFCPLSADSSQLASIMSASRGKDFVLVGPPGTGKSQTISNLIAHSIATGKRVLFVSEKMAALKMVYGRLQKEGLGQFCLELHSSKAKKATVLEALGAAWHSRGASDAQGWEAEALRLKGLRDGLNHYVERLHRQMPNGMTVHQALGRVIHGHNVPQVDFGWPDPSTHDGARLEAFREAVEKLDLHSAAFGVEQLKGTPLLPVRQTEWTPLWQAAFLRSVHDARTAAAQTSAAYLRLAEIVGLPPKVALTPSERAAIMELASDLPACAGAGWAFAARPDAADIVQDLWPAVALVVQHRSLAGRTGKPWPAQTTAACRKGLALIRERETIRAGLSAPWPATITAELERGIALLKRVTEEGRRLSGKYDVSRVNASSLVSEWRKAEESFWPLSALSKRRIRAALTVASAAGGTPNPAQDLPVLAHLEKMRAEVATIDLRVLSPGIWAGLETSTDVAQAALGLQSGLASVWSGDRWPGRNMDLVASGLCGPALKQTLDSVLRLAAIDRELDDAEWLREAQAGCGLRRIRTEMRSRRLLSFAKSGDPAVWAALMMRLPKVIAGHICWRSMSFYGNGLESKRRLRNTPNSARERKDCGGGSRLTSFGPGMQWRLRRYWTEPFPRSPIPRMTFSARDVELSGFAGQLAKPKE